MNVEHKGDSKEISTLTTKWWHFAALLGAVTLLYAALGYLIWNHFRDLPPDRRGTFGDMFGAVNTLFSAFAFAGIIFAILLQRQELNLLSSELKRQVEEQEKSRAEFERRNDLAYECVLKVVAHGVLEGLE